MSMQNQNAAPLITAEDLQIELERLSEAFPKHFPNSKLEVVGRIAKYFPKKRISALVDKLIISADPEKFDLIGGLYAELRALKRITDTQKIIAEQSHPLKEISIEKHMQMLEAQGVKSAWELVTKNITHGGSES